MYRVQRNIVNSELTVSHNTILSLTLQETQDIAASIKALARSVHGDTPFGDLPRPRLGSHI